jgi:hypothetical protein
MARRCSWNIKKQGVNPVLDHRPGAANIRTPTLSIMKCLPYGNGVEVFSNDVKVACDHCGFIVYNNFLSCVQWYKYAG